MSNDTRKCAYCSKVTADWQTIGQIPNISAPQSFILKELLSFDGNVLQKDDYVCFNHEELFRIKYLCMVRGNPFTRSCNKKFNKSSNVDLSDNIRCAKCKSSTSIKYFPVSKANVSFRNYLVNHAVLNNEKNTRKGSGISESSILCRPCYLVLWKKHHDAAYTPKKNKKQATTELVGSTPIAIDAFVDDEVVGDENANIPPETCVICGQGSKPKKKLKLYKLTENIISKVNDLRKYSKSVLADQLRKSSSSAFFHRDGKDKCYLSLQIEHRNMQVCGVCEKDLNGFPSDELISIKDNDYVQQWLLNNNKIETFFQNKIHQACLNLIYNDNSVVALVESTTDLQKDVSDENIGFAVKHTKHIQDENSATESSRTLYIDSFETFERKDWFNDLFTQIIEKKIPDQVPIHLPTVLNEITEYVSQMEMDIDILIGAPSRHEFQMMIDKYLQNNPNYSVHKPAKKSGKLLYNTNWDLIQRSYELRIEEEDEYQFFLNETSRKDAITTTADEMYHCMKELKRHIKESGRLCEVYGRHPEIMESLKLEEINFTGLEVTVDGETTIIPPIDPFLFNFFYFLTCSENEEKEFEASYSPDGKTVYSEGYSEKNKLIYSRVISLVFDILHQHNQDNIYPFAILISDMISNTGPTTLIDYLSRHRKCASSRKYEEYKKTMAAHVKKRKENGDIMGLLRENFTALHMDNLEKYQPHVRNPSDALTSSLVIAAQQPLPSNDLMKLDVGIDFDCLVFRFDDDEIDNMVSAEEPENSQEIDHEANSNSFEIDDIVEDDKSDDMVSAEKSQNSQDIDHEANSNSFEIDDIVEDDKSDDIVSAEKSQNSQDIDHEAYSNIYKIIDIVEDDKINDIISAEKSQNSQDIDHEAYSNIYKIIDIVEDDKIDDIVSAEESQNSQEIDHEANSNSFEIDDIVEDDKSDDIVSAEESQNSQEIDHEDNSSIYEIDDIVDDDMVSAEESQDSQSSNFSQEIELPLRFVLSPIKTRSSVCHPQTTTSDKRPPSSNINLESRSKRPKYDFNNTCRDITTYSAPDMKNKEYRQCKVSDFLLTEEEISTIESLKVRQLVHSLLQLEGSVSTDDSIKQCVPSLKETIAFNEPFVEKTNTAYLELIPGKPDHIDTIYYALSLIRELFIEKLGYKYVIVCGDGKTVNVLYKIKDEYGNDMSWLVIMLGSWHMMKSYLEVYFKKYENVFVRHLLSKIVSKGHVDAIIQCKNWSKSNNVAFWLISALLRIYTNEFICQLDDSKRQELSSNISTAVDILRKSEMPSRTDIEEFCKETDKIIELVETLKEKLQEFNSDGIANDDQFTLFKNAIDDFLPYVSMYIAIRTGNWTMRLAAIKLMACRFVRSGDVLYKWLSTRHLADIATSYSKTILERLSCGGWVSALKDGRGVTLARDEYHERTASRDIKLVLPKQLTNINMDVVTQYLTYGAKVRNNFLGEFFSIKTSGFELSKGCSRKWLNNQESTIKTFYELLTNEHPFKHKGRSLYQPFTNIKATPSIKKDYLGRTEFGEIIEDTANLILKSYVSPLFCNNQHNIVNEKQTMKQRKLMTFLD